jgi:leader peptidase (prepilin peptidase) / N-methyltransferase
MLMHKLASEQDETRAPSPERFFSRRMAGTSVVLALVYAATAVPQLAGHAATVPWLLVSAALAAVLIALSAIDTETFRLPDIMTLPLLAAGLALAALDGASVLQWHAVSAALGGLSLWSVNSLYKRLRGSDGLGFGDVKLFASAGAWVGIEGLASVLLVACGAALALVMIWRLRNPSLEASTALPFGPFLAFGLWIVWLVGPLA